MFSIEIEGLDGAIAALEATCPAAFAAAHDSILDGAGDISDTAKALAPKESGLMAEKIEVEDRSTDKQVNVVVQTGDRAEMGINPKDPYSYPAGIEFGTENMRPQPFMRPAAEKHGDEIVDNVSSAIAAAVEP